LTHVRILSFKTFKGGPCDRAFLNVWSVVGKSIAMIKKFKVCSHQFQQDLHDMKKTLEQHHKIWLVCAALCNLFHLQLRSWN
jgi:hypothetical protein